jgi:vesicle-fusing ATPase
MADFLAALDEVVPAFGSNTEGLELCRRHGIIDYGDAYKHLAQTLKTLVNQVGRLFLFLWRGRGGGG